MDRHALVGLLVLVTFAWDAVVGAVGYRLACGYVSRTYTVWFEAVGATVQADLDLSKGRMYCAVRARDVQGEFSALSNQVVVDLPNLPAPTSLRWEL
jgi:hypothetical protein